jgi:hypothetical protein
MSGFLNWFLSSLWGVTWGVSFFGTVDPNMRGACFFGGFILFLLIGGETALSIRHGEGDELILPAVAALLTVICVLSVLHWTNNAISLPVGVFIGFGLLLLLAAVVALSAAASSYSEHRRRLLGPKRR